MKEIIGVRFRPNGKIYYFDPQNFEVEAGSFVIVETARGVEYGKVVLGRREVEEGKITASLKPIIRIATEDDTRRYEDNKKKSKRAFGICLEKIAKHKLDMKLIEAEYTFDNNKVLFYFTADRRIDFRELVKDLASVFKTRIELRQIGVRDETKMVGGIGICGRRAVLQHASVGVRSGINQDGEGAEPVTEPYEDIRCVRKTYVLSEA